MEHKTGYLIVVCCLLLHLTVIGSDIAFFHTVNDDGVLAYLLTQGMAYLLYPLLGWLADVYFTRYKFVLLGTITTVVSTVLIIISASLFLAYPNARAIFVLAGVAIAIGLVGLGMFESTAIQFGMDQMLEASSQQLATFIQWYYWSRFIGIEIITLCTAAVLVYFSRCSISLDTTDTDKIYDSLRPYYFEITCTFALFVAILQLVCACIVICLLISSKKHFNIDKTGDHPLKLIFKVLQYAWKHKCPEKRSAFTYWEEDIPPRIDLGKNKYGGPFTTEEVEDTKTFFSILLLLFSLLGFHLSGHGYSVIDQLMRHQCPSNWIMLLLVDPSILTASIILLAIPFYQLIKHCRCCNWKYHPNMLKRMGIGLVCSLLKEAIVITIQATMAGSNHSQCHHFDNVTADSCYFLSSKLNVTGQCSTISNATDNFFHCKENDFPFLLLLIPNTFQGLSFLLVFMTTLEFICAQAPLRLKGLLIGIWYALLATNYLFVEIPEIYTINDETWKIFHSVKAFFVFLSLMTFLCVSKRYNYRLRDEVVQEQYLIEEIFERQIDQREKYEKENGNDVDYIILREVKDREKSYGAMSN